MPNLYLIILPELCEYTPKMTLHWMAPDLRIVVRARQRSCYLASQACSWLYSGIVLWLPRPADGCRASQSIVSCGKPQGKGIGYFLRKVAEGGSCTPISASQLFLPITQELFQNTPSCRDPDRKDKEQPLGRAGHAASSLQPALPGE